MGEHIISKSGESFDVSDRELVTDDLTIDLLGLDLEAK